MAPAAGQLAREAARPLPVAARKPLNSLRHLLDRRCWPVQNARMLRLLSLAVLALLALDAPAIASNTDLHQVGAALALPVLTGGQGPNLVAGSGDVIFASASVATFATVLNGKSEPIRLLVDVISGDPPPQTDQCRSTSFACDLAAGAVATFVVSPLAGPGSELAVECADLDSGGTVSQSRNVSADNGILFVAVADPNTGQTISEDVVFGTAMLVDFVRGQSFSMQAIAFQAGSGQNDGDKVYRFDGEEYARFPGVVATNFLAPTAAVNAELILFTLDATAGASPPPRVRLGGLAFNDDEEFFDFAHQFDCFDVVALDAIDPNFAFSASGSGLGSIAGHLSFSSQPGSSANDVHDVAFGDGNSVRRRPVHGWIVQDVAGTLLPAGQPVPGAPGQTALMPALWGRPLVQGRTALAPFLRDLSPALDLDPWQ
jgi:hypothetical protein